MLYSVRMRADDGQRHICGAEGIFHEKEIHKIQSEYLSKALTHTRGKAKNINFTIEELPVVPIMIKSLPVCTCGEDARNTIINLLKALKCSNDAIYSAIEIIYNQNDLRGAAIIDSNSGLRLDNNKSRGLRAVRFGLTEYASNRLDENIRTFGLVNTRAKEGLQIASKISSCPDVLAELCVSDNPDYTTGYVASNKYGYVRIPNIKEYNSDCGGRVIFTKSKIDNIKKYLEDTIVLINEISDFKGNVSINEIIGSFNS
ncbi:MAG: 6-carboxyhexanoate--CoA ligase [Nitrospirae bacterium]|nr:6-carboxyhexanoate--CoA ligase [Nitrospirota bacterium]MBF0542022.1 6-carboxyhexanoate--CoA ligase [Nitrospirota bacterium]